MNLIRILFALLIIRPLVFIVLGINVRHRQRLPHQGPAIIVANHNSHLDTLVLLTLFPLSRLHKIRPVAAADYFLKNRFLAWFSLHIMNIIPLERKKARHKDGLFAEVYRALDRGELIILYPEGSRGEPEQVQKYKSGIYHLVKERPETPIYPVFMHGLGKALPKGDFILVPFFCDVFVGQPFYWQSNRRAFMDDLQNHMQQLADEGDFAPWED
jgi:1-acyl-sn-glycerol-3-phosphate acyltransferase